MSAPSPIENLKNLCTENKNTIGEIVRLLTEINSSAAAPIARLGTCYPPTGAAFTSTKPDCDSVLGMWVGKSKDEVQKKLAEIEKNLPPKGKELNRLFAANMKVVQKLMEALRDANKAGPAEPIGVCRLADGKCVPGTEKECNSLGGTWSGIALPRKAHP